MGASDYNKFEKHDLSKNESLKTLSNEHVLGFISEGLSRWKMANPNVPIHGFVIIPYGVKGEGTPDAAIYSAVFAQGPISGDIAEVLDERMSEQLERTSPGYVKKRHIRETVAYMKDRILKDE